MKGRSCAADFFAAQFALLARGYILEVRAVRKGSFHATVRSRLETVVGSLEYRDPRDELEPSAQGLSYWVNGTPDTAFAIVANFIRGER